MDSSIDALMFLRLNASDAAVNTATSLAPTARARFVTLLVGHEHRIRDTGGAMDAAKTSLASASCGTHFGLTKLVASIVRSPVADSRSISAILSGVAMTFFSFCSPSRGPTSTMRTLRGHRHVRAPA
jgi:hypothetical protein